MIGGEMSRKARAGRRYDEPSPADLAAIEREWPLIEAEMAMLDAQIVILSAEGGRPSPLDWRRLRRAQHRAMRTAVNVAANRLPQPARVA
jgi:hypothetical protein